MKRTVRIEQKHIDRGVICDCEMCPVAQALIEQIADAAQVQVGDDFATIYDEHLNVVGEYELPPEVARFVADFDNEVKVKPFSFELNMINDFNFCRRCQRATGITSDLRCAACGELVCLVCGCTQSVACIDGNQSDCGWARPGICTRCIAGLDSQGNPNGALVEQMVIENQANIKRIQ